MLDNFTKADLEDIWHNKPYGWFKANRKKLKGKKKYKVAYRHRTVTYGEYIDDFVEVYAVSESFAKREAEVVVRDKLRELHGPSGFQYSIRSAAF